MTPPKGPKGLTRRKKNIEFAVSLGDSGGPSSVGAADDRTLLSDCPTPSRQHNLPLWTNIGRRQSCLVKFETDNRGACGKMSMLT